MRALSLTLFTISSALLIACSPSESTIASGSYRFSQHSTEDAKTMAAVEGLKFTIDREMRELRLSRPDGIEDIVELSADPTTVGRCPTQSGPLANAERVEILDPLRLSEEFTIEKAALVAGCEDGPSDEIELQERDGDGDGYALAFFERE